MSPHDPFLTAILEQPDDDTARLVCADWLEERGDPRAEFIRVQCTLARLPAGDDRRPQLEARELQLLAEHRKEWTRPLRPWVKECDFRRGFVEGIKVRAEVFLEQGETIARLAPIQHVHLVGAAGLAQDLANFPLLARVRSLALTDPACVVGQRPRWQNYRRVNAGNPLGTRTLETILSSRHLGALRELAVPNFCLGSAGMRVLAGSARLAQIESLDLRNNDFGEGDTAMLATAPNCRSLRQLRMGSCASYDRDGDYREDLIFLFQREVAPLFGRLDLLDAGSCGMNAPGLRFLGGIDRQVPLGTLLLERSSLPYTPPQTFEELHSLFQLPVLARVHTLDLSSCYLGPDAIRALADSPQLAGLVSLGLHNNPIGPQGAEALANSPHLGRLQRLELAGSRRTGYGDEGRGRLDDDGACALLAANGLPQLAALDLRSNFLTARTVQALASAPLAARLWWLDLRHNALGNEGANEFLKADWPRLAWLDLRGNRIGATHCQALRRKFGHAVRF